MPATLGSEASMAASASGLEDTMPSLLDEAPVRPTPPSVTSSAAYAETSQAEKWWEWLTHKAEDVEGWVEGFINDHVGAKEDGKKDG
jgi:hypothetical protein